jgi:hypothetical protein
LSRRGFNRIALVTGESSDKQVASIIERFAPIAKGKLEGERPRSPLDPIDILITTDRLSEGQNLQDADFVVNYDIHWNPVRVIQRIGRIDRLKSPNTEIFCANFWPSGDVDKELNLKNRVEDRMAAMMLMGSEVPKEFTKSFFEKTKEQDIEEWHLKRMMKQMRNTLEDIGEKSGSLSFGDLSMSRFRDDWLAEMAARKSSSEIPDGVFTGFLPEPGNKSGLVALLRDEFRTPMLAYVGEDGVSVISRFEEILDFLKTHKNHPRVVPRALDEGDPATIAKFSNVLRMWLENQQTPAAVSEIADLFTGAEKTVKTSHVENRLQSRKLELVCWFVVG